MEDHKVTGIICDSKQGRIAITGKVFIDASGDADLMERAGAETVKKDSICSHWTYELDFEQMKEGMKEGNILSCLKLRWLGLRPDMNNENSVGIVCWGLADPAPVYEYPYGGIADSKLKNVFAAGRIVAIDEERGWEMMRLIPACVFTGEVAGVAAAQLIADDADALSYDDAHSKLAD